MSGLRACFVGDSLTLGVGDPAGQGWVGRLAAAAGEEGCDLTAYNLGIRRETSADIARRWEAEVRPRLAAGQPGLIVFSFGTNDCLEEGGARRVARVESLANAGRMLIRAREIAPVLMVGPPPTADAAENERIGALSASLEAVCGDLGIPFVPVFALLLASAEWRRELREGDGYHPGAGGYARLAAIVAASSGWRAAAFGGEGCRAPARAIAGAVSPAGNTTSY